MTTGTHSMSKVDVKEILWVGEDNFSSLSHFGIAPEEDKIYFRESNNFFKASQWLKSRIQDKSKHLPYAIMVNFDSLEEDNFRFLTQINTEASLKELPLIVYTNSSGRCDSQALLKLGIDDCFELPLDWDRLKSRINFLHSFKPKIINQSVEREELSGYKIPLNKRIFDIVCSGAILLLASPLLAIIALAIKFTSKGAIIYKSQRVGTGYLVFDFLKFRSMYPDADQRLEELKHLNQYKDGDSTFVKFKNDPRITPIGRIIRKTSLDELPQLINVLKGDMSLVGNRPLPLYEAELLTKDNWAKRFLAPAGITGLWQVSKRGKDDMSTEERIDLDCEYADKYSLWYDIKLIAKTFPAMIQHEDV
jgi:lipopolysaccharide/colanic/teichoic acid biosynthesis glycosyltransferase